MSALAFINLEDVPLQLRETSVQRLDDNASITLIYFDGCPLVGQCEAGVAQIEYPFPRAPDLRNALVEWLLHWSINFYVIAG
ncbi:phage portal protein [Paraburkholderia sp. CNPSo 3157]|uniref:Phage portal protein n=1 Tax=Paraburkholderia franconis TaxID=2654983 RepID=A0A7X1TG69_9BURK|nr:phage portal protein [Paraburkholderia franconis]MPW17894.1 phage portal protein [Paraburkholderia franconis]